MVTKDSGRRVCPVSRALHNYDRRLQTSFDVITSSDLPCSFYKRRNVTHDEASESDSSHRFAVTGLPVFTAFAGNSKRNVFYNIWRIKQFYWPRLCSLNYSLEAINLHKNLEQSSNMSWTLFIECIKRWENCIVFHISCHVVFTREVLSLKVRNISSSRRTNWYYFCNSA